MKKHHDNLRETPWKKEKYILGPLTAPFSCFLHKGLHFHFAQGPANNVTSPELLKKTYLLYTTKELVVVKWRFH